MRVLVVCLLSVLGCSVAEGAIVSKCELKQKLTDKIRGWEVKNGLDVDESVAKIVCHTEYAAGFKTDTVKELTIHAKTDSRRKRRDAGLFDLAEYEQIPTTAQPHNQRHAREASPKIIVYTLYGLFQLSNHLVCNDGRTETHNICDMECNKLVDDNIEDDIDCVLTILKHIVEDGFSSPYFEDLTKMIKLIFQDECRNVKPSEYFKKMCII